MVPDSHAMVDLVVDGEKVQFMGFGYHDKVCLPLLYLTLCVGLCLIGVELGQSPVPEYRQELVLGPCAYWTVCVGVAAVHASRGRG